MPKYLKTNQDRGLGFIPIVILIAAAGILLFLFVSNTFEFRDNLFSKLFPKPPSHAAQQAPSVPDEILFKFKPGVTEDIKNKVASESALQVKEKIPHIDVFVAKVNPNSRDAVIEALKHNPNIEYAQPNYIGQSQRIPNDPNYAQQWNLPKIQAPNAWDISTGSQNIVVAVIDSGVNGSIADLSGKVISGYNFVDNNSDTSDVHGHGTAVSSVIAANTNNNTGIAGVNWLSRILAVRDVDSTGHYNGDNQLKSIIFAADNGAKVINLSQGGNAACDSASQDAVNYAWSKGLVVVAAAGNDPTVGILAPANCNNVIAAGATDENDLKTSFSATGSQLDVVAPGINIPTAQRDGTYGYWVGTSFSSPHVAGLGALIMAANPALTNQQVVDTIESTAKDLGAAGRDDSYGWGRINAYQALLAATGGTPAPATPTPTSTPTTNSVVISNISSTTTANTATISWITNLPATSWISYGLSSTNLNSSTAQTTLNSQTISNLTKQTRYYYQIHSQTSTGLTANSQINQFRTKNR